MHDVFVDEETNLESTDRRTCWYMGHKVSVGVHYKGVAAILNLIRSNKNNLFYCSSSIKLAAHLEIGCLFNAEQKLFIKMKLILLATSLLLCSLHTSEAVGINSLKAVYDVLDPALWYKLQRGEVKLGEGEMQARAGFEFNLTDAFWADKCVPKSRLETYGDYCFIVQTSCRESEARRAEVLKSAKNDILEIIKKADISTFSLVTYSKDAKVELSWSSDVGQIGNILDNRQEGTCDDCKAETHKALDACNNLFKQKEKDEAPDNIIIFTDGISIDNKYNMENSRKLTNDKAFDIKNQKQHPISSIQVIRIHPTESPVERTGVDEWKPISYTNTPDTFPANTVVCPNLGVQKDQSVELVLGEISIPLEDQVPCCTADVVFIVDRSNSITKPDLSDLLEFLDDFLKASKILSPTAVDRINYLQIAILSYNRRVYTHAKLGQYGKEGLIKAARKIPRKTATYTQTHIALAAAQKELQSSRARPNVRKIVVICTDGRTWKANRRVVDSGADTIKAAQKLKDIGAEIYVAGLPNHKENNDGYEREWKKIGSEPINCTVVNMQIPGASFKDLIWVGIHLTEEICINNKKKSCKWDEK
ncbi:unnamed protein product [Owenia fusiformis]|uniref:Uncharacterized protein n=1 Tax=Owenia fusiformis TaxID=6347 RepID=A0A8J1TE43_OWEFU|nr:unnamed protein product [Owenia fusiformis]